MVTGDTQGASSLGVADWVSSVAGIILMLSLFAPWERRPASDPALTETLTGWGSFALIALLLVAAAAVPIYHAVRRWLGRRGLAPLVVVSAGAAAVTVVLFGMASSLGVDSEPAAGLYVGLVAGAAIAVGGALRLFLDGPPSG